MKLLEVMDSPYDWRWFPEMSSASVRIARFGVPSNGALYSVFFEDSGAVEGYWDSGFYFTKNNGAHREYRLENSTINPLRIYATVLDIYEQFLKAPPPDLTVLNIECADARTLGVYTKGIQRILGRVKGYTMQVRGGDCITIRKMQDE